MDIKTDINVDKKIETSRFGHFVFTLGIDFERIETLFKRLEDAQARFKSSPLSSIANDLEAEVVVRSVFGTNTIEQGKLSEEEIRVTFRKSPEEIQTEQERRVINIRDAYDYIKQVSQTRDWQPDISALCHIHKLIYKQLTNDAGEKVEAGILRNNPKEIKTMVGDKEHGGSYQPPQFEGDIRLLLNALLDWNKELIDAEVPALIRAPLMHYYFEQIHPFADGNGRVGRVFEAGILYSDGFRYAPFAQASYYLKYIHKYFALFNTCRREAKKKRPYPNHQFVQFFLEGMFETIHQLHDRVDGLVGFFLFETRLKSLFIEKHINKRQYHIVKEIIKDGPMTAKELKVKNWYLMLYQGLTDKTKQRDLKKLLDEDVLSLEADKKLSLFGLRFFDGKKKQL